MCHHSICTTNKCFGKLCIVTMLHRAPCTSRVSLCHRWCYHLSSEIENVRLLCCMWFATQHRNTISDNCFHTRHQGVGMSVILYKIFPDLIWFFSKWSVPVIYNNNAISFLINRTQILQHWDNTFNTTLCIIYITSTCWKPSSRMWILPSLNTTMSQHCLFVLQRIASVCTFIMQIFHLIE